ncbi:acyl-CoA N-acyltransferase [Phlegmacium glaucopus]|nr:acyl-CoA N-acyltransferase [Phlegmacium glaucopus]
MANAQLYPLEINQQTKEPFLRLRKHKNIILTPPRWEDADALFSSGNDPRVNEWLTGPVPYPMDAANNFLSRIVPAATKFFEEMEDFKNDTTLKVVDECPVRAIREVQDDGTEIYIGDIGISRCKHGELIGLNGVDWENGSKHKEVNDALEVGDPRILWALGDFLMPSHHRQGIMTDAIDTLLHEWAIPRMKVRHVMVAAFTGNEASVKVFLRNGFKMINIYENYKEIRGKMRGLHVMEWKYSEL